MAAEQRELKCRYGVDYGLVQYCDCEYNYERMVFCRLISH